MNCCKCGKKLVAGLALCNTCEKDLERVPDENIRLGYYARHPEALAELLMKGCDDDLGHAVCKHDCVSAARDDDVECTNEGYAACIARWLMEPIEGGQQGDGHGTEPDQPV